MEGNAKDFILALEGLEREKNIKRADILKTIEDALVSALRKNLGKTAQITANIDVANGSIKAFQTLNVVEVVMNPEMEISVEDAKKHLKNPKVGDVVTNTVGVEDFSRIAAQIAKQVLIQKVRGIERENFYKEYKPREGEVITGSVRRMSDRDIIVDLGKVEAILPYCEQIKKERYTNGSRIKAVIAKVLNQNDFANIGISTHSMSLSFFVRYLEKDTDIEIMFVGIEPETMDWGERPTPEVEKSANEFIESLKEIVL